MTDKLREIEDIEERWFGQRAANEAEDVWWLIEEVKRLRGERQTLADAVLAYMESDHDESHWFRCAHFVTGACDCGLDACREAMTKAEPIALPLKKVP